MNRQPGGGYQPKTSVDRLRPPQGGSGLTPPIRTATHSCESGDFTLTLSPDAGTVRLIIEHRHPGLTWRILVVCSTIGWLGLLASTMLGR